jgi:hypothetical protein
VEWNNLANTVKLMTPCTPAPPCDTEFPLLCEPLELTSNGKRIIVEDSAACQKTLANPSVESVLAYDAVQGKLKWVENTLNSCDPFATSTTATKVLVEESNGCKKTLVNPTVKSFLSYDTTDSQLKWVDPCDPLQASTTATKVVVEESAGCKKTIAAPTVASYLAYDITGNKVEWKEDTGAVFPTGSGVLTRNAPSDPVAWTTGTNGQYLRIGSSGFPEFANVTNQWITRNQNASIVSGQQIMADTTAGQFTLILPATPAINSFTIIADATGFWQTNNLTVNRNGQTIEGLAEDLICNVSGKLFTLIFNGTTWRIFTV